MVFSTPRVGQGHTHPLDTTRNLEGEPGSPNEHFWLHKKRHPLLNVPGFSSTGHTPNMGAQMAVLRICKGGTQTAFLDPNPNWGTPPSLCVS